MNEEPKTIVSEMAPPPLEVSRVGSRARLAIQLFLAVAILVSTFYLGIIYHTRIDLTRDGKFTLSEQTVKLLNSPQLQQRAEPVKIIAALRKNSPHYDRLRALVEEYEALADGKLAVDYLDPIRDQDRALEVANNYSDLLADQLFNDDIFIIDARAQKVPGSGAEARIQALAAGLRYIRVSDMLVIRSDDNKQRRVVGYRDEDMLTSFLQSALEGRPRVMYFISDKSDIDVADGGAPSKMLTETMGRLNVVLAPIRISEIEAIPENAEGVVIAAPKYDFNARELDILEDYWKQKGAAFLVTLDPSANLKTFRSFLRRQGVTPRNDRIIKVVNGRTETQVQAVFSVGTPVNDVTVSLEGKASRFEGRIASLEVREGAEDLSSKGIRAFAVIETAPGYWGEVDYKKADPSFDDSSDNPGPLFLGAAVTRGNTNVDREGKHVGKMLILSTSDFLNPDRIGAAQLDFVKNTTHWLLGREELMGIGPRGMDRHKLNLIPSESSMLQNIVVFFIPAGFLILALSVWNSRRA
jgi:hypothetical protein